MLAHELTGTAAAPLVVGLRGRPVLNTAPVLNQVLAWNGPAWAPATPAGISGAISIGSGTPGKFAEWTSTAVMGNSPITDASGSLTSTEPIAAPSLTTNGSGAGMIKLLSGATSVS